ncbi:hypothetical protein [Ovoidimarina sediminis]|uniref:hypothetical protein n=1 Tax=Ovoidimarina sediminis TaxID=3079856 RepID=UPI00291489CA|nr:hypothetical protein [Rhodophyticola sp. MJ-SS7]MDU8946395.1 hypothetical protein [Rhodophyticola sp. MJ-SS7]
MNAHEWADHMLNDLFGDDPSRFERIPFELIYLKLLEKIGSRIFEESLTEEDARSLVWFAMEHEIAFSHLKAVVEVRLTKSLPLPRSLSNFAALLVSRPKSKKKRGQKKKVNRDEYIAIVMICLCQAYGLKATRSAEGKGDRPDCAASVVSEVLKNPPLSESSVVTIWQKSKARQRYEESV